MSSMNMQMPNWQTIFAVSELVISRAGANSICELLALHKPNILIPLSRNASRGDQILNANSFQKQGFSYVIEEEELTDQTLSECDSDRLDRNVPITFMLWKAAIRWMP